MGMANIGFWLLTNKYEFLMKCPDYNAGHFSFVSRFISHISRISLRSAAFRNDVKDGFNFNLLMFDYNATEQF